jgi:5-oxoprolinase (ATP-hydrolysing)
VVPGPAILIDAISTIVVEPGWTSHITGDHNVRIERSPSHAAAASSTPSADQQATKKQRTDGAAAGQLPAAGASAQLDASECDPIQLAIFSHRWLAAMAGLSASDMLPPSCIRG